MSTLSDLITRRALAPVVLGLVVGALFVTSVASAEGFADDSLARPTASTLTYGTYFGGSGLYENIDGVTTDPHGNVFITGSTDGTIPVTAGALQTEAPGGGDAFVAKIDEAGALVWATYLGGSHGDAGQDLAIGPDGSVYVTGVTLSEDFPTTPGALQGNFKGINTDCEFICAGDAFVTRISADGSALEYSTYLGGSVREGGTAIAVNDAGEAIVAGDTSSPDFPIGQGALDGSYGEPSCFDMCDADAFVAHLNAAGTNLKQSTYFGGTSWDSPADLALDAAGNVFIGGSTRSTDLPTTAGAYQVDKKGTADFDFSGFVAAFDGELATARYVTYLGGRSEEHVTGLVVQPDGSAWVTGFGGRGIPTTADALQTEARGSSDAFVTGLTTDGSGLVYSTRFGGSREDYGRGIAVDDRGRLHFSGSTASDDLRVRRAVQPGNAGFDDLFYARFKPGAARVQRATYLGGRRFETATDLALSPAGSAYLVGTSESRDMPLAGSFVQADGPGNDGVLMRIDDGRLVHAKVDDAGFWQPRMRPILGTTVKWHFANTNKRANRLVETAAALFDTKGRRPGAEYYFTFPAGRFSIAHVHGDVVQRIAVRPVAGYADGEGVEVRWARFTLGDDITFDVQVKIDGGDWEAWLEGTSEIGAVYPGGVANYRFRARVHNAASGMVSPWSPPALLSEPD